MKKELAKKYVLIILTIVLIILVGFYIFKIYNLSQDNNLDKPLISKYVTDVINYVELDSYIKENNNSTLYIGISDNYECREFEKVLRDVIKDYELKDKIVVLNLHKNSESLTELKKNMFNDEFTIPALVVFENGKVKNTLTKTNSYDDMKVFLEKYGVIND